MSTGTIDISPLALTGSQWEAIFNHLGDDIRVAAFHQLDTLLTEARRALDAHPAEEQDTACSDALQRMALYDTTTDNDWTFILTVDAGGGTHLATGHLDMQDYTTTTEDDDSDRPRSGRAYIRVALHELITHRNRLLLTLATTEATPESVLAFVHDVGLDADHLAQLLPTYTDDLAEGISSLIGKYGTSATLNRLRALVRELAPLATIQAGQLICPVCDGTDTIAEVDTAIRRNPLTVDADTVTAKMDATNFQHAHFCCLACATKVRLHPDLEVIHS